MMFSRGLFSQVVATDRHSQGRPKLRIRRVGMRRED